MIVLNILKAISILTIQFVCFLIKKYFETLIEKPLITIIMTTIVVVFW